MKEIQTKTCIKFKPKKSGDKSFIYITNKKRGCHSKLGFLNAPQQLNLEFPGCRRHGTIIHEFMHALGFYHEQSRPDRDNYITVNFNNVEPPSKKYENPKAQFQKYTTNIDVHRTPYDLCSVMHYWPGALGKVIQIYKILN